MVEIQNVKYALALAPQSINDTDTDGTEIDTLGYSYLTIVFLYGASTTAMQNLSLRSSTTSGGTFNELAGSRFGTDASASAGNTPALPSASDDNKVYVWNVSLFNKNRYWKIRVDPGAAATLVGAVAILSRGAQAPNTDTERGVGASYIIL
jgi:hypothetical protein